MSSLAQEESRSISENVTWGQRKRFADGKVNLPYKQFLGYRKGADGFPEVVPEEAIVVHRIYTRFMEGLTPGAIAKELTADGIPTPSRKQRWQTSTVESILQNEKYKGAALLQKCFTVDFLTKKQKVNEGEVPQYYVEHSHEPIIAPEDFDKVQAEFVRRKQFGLQYSGKSIFASRIVCGDCGSFYGAKVWNSNNKYRRVVWQCNNKFKGGHRCGTPHLDEKTIKARFVDAFNAVLGGKDDILADCRLMQTTLTDCTGIDAEIERLLPCVDMSKVQLAETDDSANYLVTMPADMSLSFGAVAKGCASDYAIQAMRAAGVTSGVVSLGGNVQTLGKKPDGSDWNIAVQDPNDTGSYLGYLTVGETAVITSGSYQRFFAEGGQDGFCKIISENTSGRLLGVHIAGGNASELIYGAAAMLANKMTVEEIKNTAFPHPTVSEAIREAIFR